MSYIALYRKFRPKTFYEIIGEDHIVHTIKNQVVSGRVGHAYLFSGGRGTGKTSIAKVLSRAVNCVNLQEGEPCNECEPCKAILTGSNTDVMEMDAASNNSVEDIRKIREEVNFLPAASKYRVYIIDEVHMLSTGAFNALLKTLEEPPKHVIFMLATTEPNKLPATILSRCQRFDFKRLAVEDIALRLTEIAKASDVKITEGAVRMIAILAEGAMRDGISILERCIEDSKEEISEDKVKDLVGIPSYKNVHALIEHILKADVEGALTVFQEIVKQGKDLLNTLWELIKYTKDILVFQTTGKLELYQEEELRDIAELSKIASKDRLVEMIYLFSELESGIKWSTQGRVLFEVAIVKATVQDMSKPEVKEKKKVEVQKVEKIEKAVKGEGVSYWAEVIETLKKTGKVMLYTNLMNTTAKEISDLVIGIEFPKGLSSFGKTVIEKPENIKELKRIIAQLSGKEMNIKCLDSISVGANSVRPNPNIEDAIKDLDIPVNIVE